MMHQKNKYTRGNHRNIESVDFRGPDQLESFPTIVLKIGIKKFYSKTEMKTIES